MSFSSDSLRGSRAFERLHPILGAAPLADRLRASPMSDAEARARAFATWRALDAETDTPDRETLAKARRLADVARDLHRARTAKARLTSALGVVRYLMAVITRAWGVGAAGIA
jgi:hypothetical protein